MTAAVPILTRRYRRTATVTDWQSAPGNTELEFTALGPGYGECLVLHLGFREWMIVDSCLTEDDEQPALQYLRRLGVDVATEVKLVVATHWHDDHVQGMQALVDACQSARFACSAVLGRKELLGAIGRRSESERTTSSGVKEMRAVLKKVAAKHRPRAPRPMWVLECTSLHYRAEPYGCEVRALSPSSRMLGLAYQRIGSLLEQSRFAQVPRDHVNDAAVALWVEAGDATLLLGSDLEEKSCKGWTAAIACGATRGGKAEIIKVPHHGSEGAHHPPVWAQLLHPRPHAIVCSFHCGNVDLPTDKDVERLCQAARLHRTTPDGVRTVLRDGRLVKAFGPMGRVTLRRTFAQGNNWDVHYEGGCTGCPPPPPT